MPIQSAGTSPLGGGSASALNRPADATGAAVPDVVKGQARTDPALWRMLTTEERASLERIQALGPIVYGRRVETDSNTRPSARGLRLDVRV